MYAGNGEGMVTKFITFCRVKHVREIVFICYYYSTLTDCLSVLCVGLHQIAIKLQLITPQMEHCLDCFPETESITRHCC